MNWATVRLDGADIPLIGVPAHATQERCDRCRKEFHLGQITLRGRKFLCPACHRMKTRNKHRLIQMRFTFEEAKMLELILNQWMTTPAHQPHTELCRSILERLIRASLHQHRKTG